MKKVAKVVVLGLVLVPIAFLSGCAKRCCKPEPVCCDRLEKMRDQCGGCK